MTAPSWVLGLDLGQTADPTALAALQRRALPGGNVYELRHLPVRKA